VLVVAASLVAAAAVAFSGVIGFVGLAAPHLVRLLWGSDYRRLLPLPHSPAPASCCWPTSPPGWSSRRRNCRWGSSPRSPEHRSSFTC